MFSYLLGPAFSYWRLPLFAAGSATDRALTTRRDCIDWLPQPRSPDPSEPPPGQSQANIRAQGICEVLSTNDLYHILGVSRSPVIDRLTPQTGLSLAKCPGNPDATHAFQRVSIAYGVLSQPSLKRMYDASPNGDQPDFLRSPPCGYADETLKGVLLSIVSDFLDGNLEMIRTLLQAISDLNPSLKLGHDGINSVLSVLENITRSPCRACILALHSELYAFRQLPYLDITSRSRLTIQLTRITLSLPVHTKKRFRMRKRTTTDGRHLREGDKAALLPKHVVLLIRGIDMVLDKMERVLG
ncbi:hypothetical protein L210DRAFT_3614156 [Boletus edulis BED1]|uniref:J domain-containing protein n=1 Tax=Boletus edulis BED1 TaxID=1328754 RepID=A0AAD4GB96_BOLED|nr:hypothetical protein L210DRAFT_3614156 [Boletus edulis BED1]